MAIEIKVPVLPESVADATVGSWHKKPGELVRRDENLVDVETDKVVLEVVAPADGVLTKILYASGAVVKAEEVIATFEASSSAQPKPAKNSTAKAISKPVAEQPESKKSSSAKLIPEPVAAQPNTENKLAEKPAAETVELQAQSSLSPSMRRAVGEGVAPHNVADTNRIERRVPMTRLRAKIAERLLAAQQNAAILTTFNEINMAPVIALRNNYKEDFMQKYGVRLGYMSFFVSAVVAALKNFPEVNASIDANEIVYHGYFDIGIAVSTDRGLVVPILRDADTLSMAEMEQKIANFGRNAREGKLSIEDITGGTFTITNGGVFGSLMATPILNPPQSAILGMHKIEERPVVENKQIVIRPMMYVALSYDHRIIDGAQSVQFLVMIKEMLEDPARLILKI